MPKPKPVTINQKTYRSINEAAQTLGVNKSSLSKIIKSSKTPKDLEVALRLAKERSLGYHEKSIEINGKKYSSLKNAGKAFGVTGRAVAYWVEVQGSTSLEIDIDKLKSDRLEKGSLEHMRVLANKAGFFCLNDWVTKKRQASNLGTFNDWLRDIEDEEDIK